MIQARPGATCLLTSPELLWQKLSKEMTSNLLPSIVRAASLPVTYQGGWPLCFLASL